MTRPDEHGNTRLLLAPVRIVCMYKVVKKEPQGNQREPKGNMRLPSYRIVSSSRLAKHEEVVRDVALSQGLPKRGGFRRTWLSEAGRSAERVPEY